MSFTLTTSFAIIRKAGDGASPTIVASSNALANWSDQAEATLSLLTRKDWVTAYSSIPVNFLPLLDDACSSYAAMQAISYDMSGYTSRLEAQTMLDLHRDTFNRIVDKLLDFKFKEVFTTTT